MVGALGDALYPACCVGCRSLFRYDRSDPFDSDRSKLGHRVEVTGLLDQTAAGVQPGSRLFATLMVHLLCPDCRSACVPARAPYCSCCGTVFESRSGDNHVCGDCIQKPKQFTRARAFGIYTGSLRALTQAYKYAGKVQLAEPLSLLLLAAYRYHWPRGDIDLVVPVPLNIKRLRQRGFNQAFLPIRHWPALASKLNWRPPGRVAANVIERHRRTEPQASIGRKKRASNVKDAFRIVEPNRIAARRILLIDDVYTTGATVNECAGVLMRAGAARVEVLTLARAL